VRRGTRAVGGILSSGRSPGTGCVVIHLCGLPGGIGRAARPLFDLAPGGVCRSAPVARGAGALLPHRFTLTCADRSLGRPSAVCSLLHFPADRPDWLSPAPCPVESRPSSTRSNRAATTRPGAPSPRHRTCALSAGRCRLSRDPLGGARDGGRGGCGRRPTWVRDRCWEGRSELTTGCRAAIGVHVGRQTGSRDRSAGPSAPRCGSRGGTARSAARRRGPDDGHVPGNRCTEPAPGRFRPFSACLGEDARGRRRRAGRGHGDARASAQATASGRSSSSGGLVSSGAARGRVVRSTMAGEGRSPSAISRSARRRAVTRTRASSEPMALL
jgi:hypothetical protein